MMHFSMIENDETYVERLRGNYGMRVMVECDWETKNILRFGLEECNDPKSPQTMIESRDL